MTGSPRHTYPHPQESSHRPHRSRGHRVRFSLCRAYTRHSKIFWVPFFYASKIFLGSTQEVHPYCADKNPVYPTLLAVQGWSLCAENLLYQEAVNGVKPAKIQTSQAKGGIMMQEKTDGNGDDTKKTLFHLTWGTMKEKEFIDTMGGYYGGGALFPRDPDARKRYLRLLIGYRKGMKDRVNWGDIDPIAIRQYVDWRIARESITP
jgi:hypothetical protein